MVLSPKRRVLRLDEDELADASNLGLASASAGSSSTAAFRGISSRWHYGTHCTGLGREAALLSSWRDSDDGTR
jgi:hypothetical protein